MSYPITSIAVYFISSLPSWSLATHIRDMFKESRHKKFRLADLTAIKLVW